MPIILNGRAVSRDFRERIKNAISNIDSPPILAIIIVGNVEEESYIKIREKGCKEVGIIFKRIYLPENIENSSILSLINELNNNEDIKGIIINSPLPNHINLNDVREAISPLKDVGCITSLNIGRFISGNPIFSPCIPLGIIKLLNYYGIDVKGLNATVIGRSSNVGKPIGIMLLNKNSTVTICHTKTPDIHNKIKDAQLLISAAGRRNMIKGDMVMDGAIIVDVGMNMLDDGIIVGDVDYESVIPKVSAITPVPGGVGPMNITMLLYNTLIAAGKYIDI